jgi:hypothetical protein
VLPTASQSFTTRPIHFPFHEGTCEKQCQWLSLLSSLFFLTHARAGWQIRRIRDAQRDTADGAATVEAKTQTNMRTHTHTSSVSSSATGKQNDNGVGTESKRCKRTLVRSLGAFVRLQEVFAQARPEDIVRDFAEDGAQKEKSEEKAEKGIEEQQALSKYPAVSAISRSSQDAIIISTHTHMSVRVRVSFCCFMCRILSPTTFQPPLSALLRSTRPNMSYITAQSLPP